MRSERFRLVHNAYIELPFGSPADVSESASWRALYERRLENRLAPAQQLLFQAPRPEIEFYDTDRDPFEIDNLAGRPEWREAISEHYSLLRDWQAATGDFPPRRRRRPGYVDRVTGVLYSLDVPPMYNE